MCTWPTKGSLVSSNDFKLHDPLSELGLEAHHLFKVITTGR